MDAPERHSAIRGYLNAIETHDDVIRLQVFGSLIGWLDVAHQDALLLLLHAIGRAKSMGLHALPFHAHHWKACKSTISPTTLSTKVNAVQKESANACTVCTTGIGRCAS